MHPQAILFDLDGTLVDSLGDITAAVNHTREGLGFPALAREDVRLMVGDGVEKLLLRALDGNESLAKRGLDSFRSHYAVHHLDQTRPFSGVEHLLDSLRGIPLAVVSNKPERFCREILSGLGLATHFAAIAGGDTYSERKPLPTPLTKVLEELGASPSTSFMVGDGPQDVRAGRAAGAITCAVTWGLCDRLVLEAERPDHLVDSIEDLLSIMIDGQP